MFHFFHKAQKAFDKLKNNTSGNTMLNVMITTAIIGGTASAGLGSSDDIMAQGRDARRYLDMHQMQIALQLYYEDFNHYPTFGQLDQPSTEAWSMVQNQLVHGYSQEGPWISESITDPRDEGIYAYTYGSDGQQYVIHYWTEENQQLKKLISL